jgi:hypothetical protein
MDQRNKRKEEPGSPTPSPMPGSPFGIDGHINKKGNQCGAKNVFLPGFHFMILEKKIEDTKNGQGRENQQPLSYRKH